MVCSPGGRGESASYAPADEEDEQDNKTAAQEEDRRQAAAGAAARGEDPAEDEPEGSDEGEEEEADQKSTAAAKGKKSGTETCNADLYRSGTLRLVLQTCMSTGNCWRQRIEQDCLSEYVRHSVVYLHAMFLDLSDDFVTAWG